MKNTPKSFADLLAAARKDTAYHVEGAILEFTEELCRLMEAQGVTKAELAKRLDCQPAYITKLLSGANNFTLETMVKVALVLEAELKIHLQGPGVVSSWHDSEKFTIKGQASAVVQQADNVLEDYLDQFSKPVEPVNRIKSVMESAANEDFALAA